MKETHPLQSKLDTQPHRHPRRKSCRRLNLETVHGFISTIRSEPASYLSIEMCGVSFLDSAGMGALVDLFVIGNETLLTQAGGQVRS
jgi:hypothetical protein